MNIDKIYVMVDKKKYAGLYWISSTEGKSYLNVSYAGLKKYTGVIDNLQLKAIDSVAKNKLCELLNDLG